MQLPYKHAEFISQVSAHAGQNRELCLSAHGHLPETLQYLDRNEKELVEFIFRCAEIGYAKSHKQVLALVRRLLQKKGKNVPITSGWWESLLSKFCHRSVAI